jgi:hypothetical protein
MQGAFSVPGGVTGYRVLKLAILGTRGGAVPVGCGVTFVCFSCWPLRRSAVSARGAFAGKEVEGNGERSDVEGGCWPSGANTPRVSELWGLGAGLDRRLTEPVSRRSTPVCWMKSSAALSAASGTTVGDGSEETLGK